MTVCAQLRSSLSSSFIFRGRRCPADFLGVDIFFVISGFLITSIIWREARRGQFTIVTFYDRRIRRIMPGLLLLLPITSAFAFLLLLPADLIGYAKSQLATLAFSANIYFWRDTGYFSRAAEEKPLLHLWSLGVEEQFYLLFPLLLVFLAARKPRAALYALSAMTLVSLLLNPLASKLGVDGASFWLLPMRAWELGAGAILALLPASFAPQRSTGAPSALLARCWFSLESLSRPRGLRLFLWPFQSSSAPHSYFMPDSRMRRL